MEAGARARPAATGRVALALRRARAGVADYVALTKPRVISLLLVTTLATMFVADPQPAHRRDPADDDRRLPGGRRRRRDQPLHRARHRRAHGAHVAAPAAVRPDRAALGAVVRHRARRRSRSRCSRSAVNMTAALLALAGLLGYVFVYTLWLKPRTTQNIVIGGAAGAVPPLVGWAAAAGQPRPVGLLPVRDRLLLDAAALLGAGAADQGRLRAHRDPDAAGRRRRGRDPPPDPALRLAAARDHGAAAARAGCSAPIYAVAALRARRASSCGSACACTGAPTAARRRSCSTTRCSTSRCCSRRWRSTRSLSDD